METALAIIDQARALRVTNDTEYKAAVELREACRDGIRQVKASQDPLVAAAHAAHKKATEERARLVKQFQDPIDVIDPLLVRYDNEQKAAARALLEEEQRRAAAERAELEAEAAKHEAAGDDAAAMQAYIAAETVTDNSRIAERQLLRPTPTAPVAYQEYFSAEVVDEDALPDEYWMVNLEKLNAHARADKHQFRVPGAKLVVEKKVKGGRA
jgi:hypothetical protein